MDSRTRTCNASYFVIAINYPVGRCHSTPVIVAHCGLRMMMRHTHPESSEGRERTHPLCNTRPPTPPHPPSFSSLVSSLGTYKQSHPAFGIPATQSEIRLQLASSLSSVASPCHLINIQYLRISHGPVSAPFRVAFVVRTTLLRPASSSCLPVPVHTLPAQRCLVICAPARLVISMTHGHAALMDCRTLPVLALLIRAPAGARRRKNVFVMT